MICKIIWRNALILVSRWRQLAGIIVLDLIILGVWALDHLSVTAILQGNLAIEFQQSALSFPILWYWGLIWPIFLCHTLITEIYSSTLNSVLLKVQNRSTYILGQVLSIIGLIVVSDFGTLFILSLIRMQFNWQLMFILIAGSCLVAMVWLLGSLWSVPLFGLALALLFPLAGLANSIPWLPTTMTMYLRITEANVPIRSLIEYFIFYFLGIYVLIWVRFQRMDLLGTRGN